jgi:hypothetical protein
LTDIPGDSSTTATLSVGGSASNSLETVGDHDWFKITLTAGQPVVVTVNGVTLEDPYLYIRNSSGIEIYSDDDIVDGVNRNSQVAFSPTYTGTYYIDVAAFDNSYTGTYQVSVQPYTPPPLATNDQIANELTSGYWDGDRHHFNVTQGGTITVNITSLNAAEQNLARIALSEWSDIIGVHFKEVTGGAQITFDNSEDSSGPIAATDANWSNGIISSAHVHISSSWVSNYGSGVDTYSLQTYVHEIGHALGLGHAGNYNETATYPYDALFQNDSWATSIMSYFDQNENTYFGGQEFSRLYALTPMQADIVAMQSLYGLSTTTRTGDTTYGYNSNAGGVYVASTYPKAEFTIFDNGGNDTIDYSGASGTQKINLNPETFSNVNGYTGNLSIARGVVIENAIGGSGADTIIGNTADNLITGNAGADTLTGGAGNDTFRDTAAGLNGDTITDLSAGDRILISNATLAGFNFSLSGSTLTYTGGSLTLSSVPAGTIVAAAAASGGVQLSIVQRDAVNDFNGDGKSDILWRSDTGTITDWLGKSSGGFTDNYANAVMSVATDWHIAGTGDFNGDGRDDTLWRNDSGLTVDWLGTASGGFTSNYANSAVTVPTNWTVVGTADFNGDGRDDILWRDTSSGLLVDWLANANGSFAANYVNSAVNVPTNWKVIGTGDFNGDGREDVLWRDSSSGLMVDWLANSNGSFTVNYANSAVQVPLDWSLAGTGDFNGDGITDLLWRNSAGLTVDWLGQSNGSFVSNYANSVTQVPTAWHVAAIGDYNGDGRDDILWRNDNGQITDWLGTSTGGFADNYINAAELVPTSWHVQTDLFQ